MRDGAARFDRGITLTAAAGTVLGFASASWPASGESTVSLAGRSADGTIIRIDATDMVGGIMIDGPSPTFEGQIDTVMVGDGGNVVVSGKGSIADDSADQGAGTFEVTVEYCG
ncbi:MAG: hypothetical protein OEW30_20045 [Acidimicrobiia bacterium]|nr:hypothetical protein [Acidimicrobiia bacterium]